MDEDSRGVYVAVCGRVERIDVAELSLEGLCMAVSARFDIGDRLRFISDEEGEPEVSTDEHLRKLARQKQTLRVLIGDSALSDLEQRMWQLRQLQWGFFQDELARVKNHQQGLRNELRQMRSTLEASARREVELTGEMMNERRLREKSEQASVERHEALCAELRREQRARDATEAALRKEIEDARQAALKFAATAERQNTEVKAAVQEETRARGKNVEALLAELAGSQSDIRQAIENVRADLERGAQDTERQAQGLAQEASAREALEQFFGEKARSLETALGMLEDTVPDLDRRIGSVKQEVRDAAKVESNERLAGQQELRSYMFEVLAARENGMSLEKSGCMLTLASPTALPTRTVLHTTSSAATLPRHPSPTAIQRTMASTSPGAVQRALTPPPFASGFSVPPAATMPMEMLSMAPTLITSPLGTPAGTPVGTQVLRRGNAQSNVVATSCVIRNGAAS
jgi:hypothetical protein